MASSGFGGWNANPVNDGAIRPIQFLSSPRFPVVIYGQHDTTIDSGTTIAVIQLYDASGGIVKTMDLPWKTDVNWLSPLQAVSVIDENTVLVFNSGVLYRTEDGGQNWMMDTSRKNVIGISHLSYDGLRLFSGYDSVQNGHRVVMERSPDSGKTWVEAGEWTNFQHAKDDRMIFPDSNHILMAGESGTVMYWSENKGTDWEEIICPYYSFGILYNSYQMELNRSGRGIRVGLYFTKDFGRTWSPLGQPIDKTIRHLASRGTKMLAVGDSSLAIWINRKNMEIFDRPMWKSWIGNKPADWPDLFAGAVLSDSEAVAVGGNGMLAYTTDMGYSWQQAQSDGASTSKYTSVSFADSILGVAASVDGLISRTTDGGRTWNTVRGPGLPGASCIKASVRCSDAMHFVCLYLRDTLQTQTSTPVLRSDDGGLTWSQTGTADQPVGVGLYVFDNNKWATIGGNCFSVTTNGGQSWRIDTLHQQLRGIDFIDGLTGDLVTPDSVYRTYDLGGHWYRRQTDGWDVASSSSPDYYSVCSIDAQYVWAAGARSGIWYSVSSKLGVDETATAQVSTCTLGPAYPNPVSAAAGPASIPFTLETRTQVRIELCDILGRVVRVVTDEPLTPGTYTRPCNIAGLSAGVYVISLRTNGSAPKMRTLMVGK
jgi:photosystem II stability/assembly factor-like uncharacterized protein